MIEYTDGFVGEYSKRGVDTYDDAYHVDADRHDAVFLRLYDGSEFSEHAYTPEQARQLAKRLRKAADFAEDRA